MIDLNEISGFDWDEGNARKSESKHEVSRSEAEQVFFNQPLLMLRDTKHSDTESRFHALGKTDSQRKLHVSFTLGNNDTLIRVISARDMHKKERSLYEQNR
ncbi:MAG: BrnT family toxin [Pseudomonadales bacterium]|nr:BrnT family toxin [Pseudomonadales bacterium]